MEKASEHDGHGHLRRTAACCPYSTCGCKWFCDAIAVRTACCRPQFLTKPKCRFFRLCHDVNFDWIKNFPWKKHQSTTAMGIWGGQRGQQHAVCTAVWMQMNRSGIAVRTACCRPQFLTKPKCRISRLCYDVNFDWIKNFPWKKHQSTTAMGIWGGQQHAVRTALVDANDFVMP